MKIAFLSAFYPFSTDFAVENSYLYRTIERTNEIQAFNFSVLYPELLFPGKERFVQATDVADVIASQRVLNTANPASYYATANAINSFSPDLLITRHWLPYLGASLGGTAKLVNKKTKKIAIIDSMRAADKIVFEEKINNLFVNNHDAFVVLNNQSKEDLLSILPEAFYREHPKPLFTKGIDKVEAKFARKILNIPADKNILLFFGNIRYYKGIDVILNTMAQIDDNFHLLIAGHSPSGLDYYRRKIKTLNIEKKVTIIEHKLSYSEIPYIFQAADVLLMPNDYDATIQEVNQIISYELPVIATDVGNFKENIKEFGIFIEKPESELLQNAITQYFAENMKTKFISRLDSLRYDSSWESLATILFDMYDRLIDTDDSITMY